MSSISVRLRNLLYFVPLTLLASLQISHAQSTALSLEEIVSLKQVSGVYMSPKGDQIAYLLSVPREIDKDDDGKVLRIRIDMAIKRFPRMFAFLDNAVHSGFLGG